MYESIRKMIGIQIFRLLVLGNRMDRIDRIHENTQREHTHHYIASLLINDIKTIVIGIIAT